jgi:hypothetical protein
MQGSSSIAPTALQNLRMSDRLEALHRLFYSGDVDRSGELSLEEFVNGIRPLVGSLDPAEERFLFSAFDFSNDGKINLFEFDYVLFRDLQESGEVTSVSKILADFILQKLATFRSGASSDGKHVDGLQAAVKERQARGQGAGKGCATVAQSQTSIASALGIVAVVGGIVAALLLESRGLFIVSGAGYIIHLVASFCSPDFQLISNRPTSGSAGLVAEFDAVYRANAAFRWHIECYHHETRTRTSTDSKGRVRTRTESVRVTTHVATQQGRLRSLEASPPFVPDLNSHVLTQVVSTARVTVRFAEYFAARDAWFAANTRDAHQTFSAVESVPELKPSLLVEYVPGNRPCWMAQWVFALATLMLSSLCYRVAFNARCGKQEYTFVKYAIGFAEDVVGEEARVYDAEKAAGLQTRVAV